MSGSQGPVRKSRILLYNINMITAQDFKSFFKRDFPYLPVYEADKVYWTNDEVYNEENEKFYVSLKDNNQQPLTDTDSWQRVDEDVYNYVLDEDIERAMSEMQAIIPDINALHIPTEIYQLLQFYLTAHILVDTIRTSNAGLSSQINAVTTGKSVGSVSQQFGIPGDVLNSAACAFFITSQYGMRYLVMLYPYTRGNIKSIQGSTLP